MRSLNKQKGLTPVGLILILMIVIFVFIGLIKIMPMYMNTWKINSVLKSYVEDSQHHGKQPRALKKDLYDQLHGREGIADFERDNIEIRRGQGVYVVIVDFEARRTLFGDTSVVLEYYKEIEVPSKK